ncbi:transcriptional enhancer factor TEF-3-like isoform X3 [Conger conger]|uniref:transcriptional enhancer factor TEF-3-like isoform X3 n=1 Tax=Conger conger TaxID=82655 RepID=UPI002A5A0008|nr:transcriptional enhancer factor TEF-3-like isoform X3 [Conger conger]
MGVMRQPQQSPLQSASLASPNKPLEEWQSTVCVCPRCVPGPGPRPLRLLPPAGLPRSLATTSAAWAPAPSPGGASDGLREVLEKPLENDAEGVWSPDIEQSFQEALAIYPPCGRRKIILSDEGKMYGRNELIARYIKLRTGKSRTRKQVSSHIQVLARRKARDIQVKLKDHVAKEKALQSMAAMSSAQIISASVFQNKLSLQELSQPPYPSAPGFWHGAMQGLPIPEDIKPFSQQSYNPAPITGYEGAVGMSVSGSAPPWQGRSIATSRFRMLEFTAFLEHQLDPETYNKHLFVHIGQSNPSFGEPCLEAVEARQIYDKFPEKRGGLKELFEKGPADAFFLVKFWTDCGRLENGRYVYRFQRSPLCEYMINFIHKLQHLPEKYMMNSVLENFTILQRVLHIKRQKQTGRLKECGAQRSQGGLSRQVVSNRDTLETLLCVAYVFEVSTSKHGAQYHIYRLVKD